MTATPPRADLRTLAAEGDAPMTDQVAPSPQSLCDHPVYVHHVRGGEPLTIPLCQICGAVGWNDLREQMAEHRRMVLGEAADELWRRANNVPWSDPTLRRGIQYACSVVAMLVVESAAAAPPGGLSAPVPAENAPAVPEEPDEGGNPPRDDLDDPGIRAAIAESAIACIGGRTIPWSQIRESVADVQPLIAELRGVRAEVQRSRAGWTTALDELNNTRADRDRLAAQVAHYQRVIERVRDLADRMEAEAPKPQVGGFIAEEIRAAVDALPDAGPHQHECACNRNWGGPCGPCVCEEPPRQGVWRLVCGAENIPPNQTYATKGAAEDVMRLHGGACPGTHGVEFVPYAGTNQTEGDHGH